MLRAIGDPTHAYGTPSPHSQTTATFTLGESLTFTGYCIGAPTPSLENGATDERWLIRPDGTLVPAGQLSTFSSHSGPLTCPGEPAGGPRLLSLTARYSGKGTVIHAAFAQASIVGFALYDPTTTGVWRQLSQLLGRHAGYTVTLPGIRRIAVIAAACWAYDAPAQAQTPGDFIARVLTTPSAPTRLAARAAGATPEGAQLACAPPSTVGGGKAPTVRRERITKPGPSHSTTIPAPPISNTPPATSGQSGTHTQPPTKRETTRAKPAIEQSS
jgi:hypothetical protein